MDLILVAGHSATGRSLVVRALESLGFRAADHLTAELLPLLVTEAGGSRIAVAPVIKTARDVDIILDTIRSGRHGTGSVTVLFLETSEQTLMARLKDIRGAVPVGEPDLLGALRREAALLAPLRSSAEILNTGALSKGALTESILRRFGSQQRAAVTVVSFGHKNGPPPADCDAVFDMRPLPNPHYDARLRPLDGRHPAIDEYFRERPAAAVYLESVKIVVKATIEGSASERRPYLKLAFACTGGKHRSVWAAEQMRSFLGDLGFPAVVFHRDLGQTEAGS